MTQRPFHLLCLLPALAAMAPPAPAQPVRIPPVRVQPLPAGQRSDADQFDDANLQVLPQKKLSDIFHLKAADGWIELTTCLYGDRNDPRRRLVTQDRKSDIVVNVDRDRTSGQWSIPQLFNLIFSKAGPGGVSNDIGVSFAPQSLQITATKEQNGRLREQVILFQATQSFAGLQKVKTSLYVTRWGPAGQSLPKVEFAEENFQLLRQKHPQAIDQYLRPILRDLDQEALLSPDRFVAWQVFMRDLKPDPRVKQHILRLLGQLDADDYIQRLRATHELQRTGVEGVAVLLSMDRDKLSAEQKTRLQAIIAPYRTLSRQEARQLHDDTQFLLDCLLTQSDSRLRDMAFQSLKKKYPGKINLNPKTDPSDWTEAVRQLRISLQSPPATAPAP